MSEQRITVPEAARRLGVSDSAVRQAIYTGRLRATKYGGTWLVDPAVVAAFRVAGRGPLPKGGRPRAVLREINVEGLTPEEVQEVYALADRLRAAKGAQAA